MNWSRHLICKNCLSTILLPTPSLRVLDNSLEVYSFYKYRHIKELLHTKHTYYGSEIYKLLTKNSISNFVNSSDLKRLPCIPIDDHTKEGYSHSAVIAEYSGLKPRFNSLRAKNEIRFSGMSLKERLRNKRDFSFTCKGLKEVVLIDDIVTTGTTLSEACDVLIKNGVKIRCALVLADARD